MFNELWFFFDAGGYVMPPLLLATVVLWYAVGYRIAAMRRGSKRGVRVLVERAEQGVLPSDKGVLQRALKKGLKLRQRQLPNLRRFLDEAFAEEEQELRKFNTLITTIVMTAPLLGLLGTVVGMIETFDSLADMSLFSQSGGIAGGISQALFTTQMGLAVAIPGLVVNGILHRHERDLLIELAQMKDILCATEID
ncbi:MAG: MotA/TolQ/ExbB proton channel family protein [Gammaproteobacteria bacterium]|nr:MotA/TolQ/ExbB proton channel family protein [Gammaproteobacteria bacterium]